MIELEKLKSYITRIEALYNELHRLVESNSKHIGMVKDSVEVLNVTLKGVESASAKALSGVEKKVEEKLKEFSDRMEANSSTRIALERGLERRVDTLESTLLDKQGQAMAKIDNALTGFSERIKTIDIDMASYVNNLNTAQMKFVDKVNARIDALENSVNNTHKSYMEKEIGAFKYICMENLNKLYDDMAGIRAYIVTAKSAQDSIKLYNEKDRESIYSAVNGRINNFIDDINDKLAVKNGNPKAVLKRIAKLEGVKDAVMHRKSSKEVLEALNTAQTDLLRSEVKGSIDKDALERVNTLNWVLGRD